MIDDRRRWLIEDESEEKGRSTLSASLQAGGFHSAAGIVCPFFSSGRPRAIPRGDVSEIDWRGLLLAFSNRLVNWNLRELTCLSWNEEN